jgi:protoporphyrinogen oxidase
MQRIPEQLAAMLPEDAVRLNTRADRVEAGRVTLAAGETIEADAVVVATDAHTAADLLNDEHRRAIDADAKRGWNSTMTFVFSADEAPVGEPILMLDGDGAGPINHAVVMSNVSVRYRPGGGALLYANTAEQPLLEGDRLLDEVRNQMVEWFGDGAKLWRHVTTVEVPRALPRSLRGAIDPASKPASVAPALFVAGDYRDDPSINGAMASGRRAAAAVLASLASA